MKTIITFGASSSKNSINKTFAKWTADQITNAEIIELDLNDFEMPLFSVDKEAADGVPELATKFKDLISSADGLVISFAEHNGSFSVAYKNIFDWVSRIEMDLWQGKPMLIMATSPGGLGGKRVLDHAESLYSYHNKNLIRSIALPKFHDNFAVDKGILESDLDNEFKQNLEKFQNLL